MTTVILGSAFDNLVTEEPREPDLAGLQQEMVLQALGDLRDALANMPAPVVHVDAPDLSAIVTAVSNLKPGADAADIAIAVRSQLAPVAGSDVNAKLLETLVKLDQRLNLLSAPQKVAGGGGLDPRVASNLEKVAALLSGTLSVVSTTRAGAGFYAAGSAATTITWTGGQRLLGINLSARDSDAAFTVNGGDSVTVRAGTSFTWEADGNFVNPVVVISGSSLDYFVDGVA